MSHPCCNIMALFSSQATETLNSENLVSDPFFCLMVDSLTSLCSHLQSRTVEVICCLFHLPFFRYVVKVMAEKDSTFRYDFKHFLYALTAQLYSVYCNSIVHTLLEFHAVFQGINIARWSIVNQESFFFFFL